MHLISTGTSLPSLLSVPASPLLTATLHPSFPVHAEKRQLNAASPRFMSVYVVVSHSSVLSCLKAEEANPHTSSQAASCDSAYVLNMYRVYLVFPIGMTDLRVWQ